MGFKPSPSPHIGIPNHIIRGSLGKLAASLCLPPANDSTIQQERPVDGTDSSNLNKEQPQARSPTATQPKPCLENLPIIGANLQKKQEPEFVVQKQPPVDGTELEGKNTPSSNLNKEQPQARSPTATQPKPCLENLPIIGANLQKKQEPEFVVPQPLLKRTKSRISSQTASSLMAKNVVLQVHQPKTKKEKNSNPIVLNASPEEPFTMERVSERQEKTGAPEKQNASVSQPLENRENQSNDFTTIPVSTSSEENSFVRKEDVPGHNLEEKKKESKDEKFVLQQTLGMTESEGSTQKASFKAEGLQGTNLFKYLNKIPTLRSSYPQTDFLVTQAQALKRRNNRSKYFTKSAVSTSSDQQPTQQTNANQEKKQSQVSGAAAHSSVVLNKDLEQQPQSKKTALELPQPAATSQVQQVNQIVQTKPVIENMEFVREVEVLDLPVDCIENPEDTRLRRPLFNWFQKKPQSNKRVDPLPVPSLVNFKNYHNSCFLVTAFNWIMNNPQLEKALDRLAAKKDAKKTIELTCLMSFFEKYKKARESGATIHAEIEDLRWLLSARNPREYPPRQYNQHDASEAVKLIQQVIYESLSEKDKNELFPKVESFDFFKLTPLNPNNIEGRDFSKKGVTYVSLDEIDSNDPDLKKELIDRKKGIWKKPQSSVHEIAANVEIGLPQNQDCVDFKGIVDLHFFSPERSESEPFYKEFGEGRRVYFKKEATKTLFKEAPQSLNLVFKRFNSSRTKNNINIQGVKGFLKLRPQDHFLEGEEKLYRLDTIVSHFSFYGLGGGHYISLVRKIDSSGKHRFFDCNDQRGGYIEITKEEFIKRANGQRVYMLGYTRTDV